MAVRDIVTLGDPVLRSPARSVASSELTGRVVQELIDDLVDTVRAADGAGLAAPQIGVPLRVFVVEIRAGNPRYPYKPPFPLTVCVNPVVTPVGDETYPSYEGCLSIPGLRGRLERHAEVLVEFSDRDGNAQELRVAGLTAGTFQHELDHLDGVLFPDRVVDPATFTTWEGFRRDREQPWLAEIAPMLERFG